MFEVQFVLMISPKNATIKQHKTNGHGYQNLYIPSYVGPHYLLSTISLVEKTTAIFTNYLHTE